MKFIEPIPLSLYIHMPWCIRKCPYCDFNSHELSQNWPEQDYIACLIADLEQDLPKIWNRSVSSIFIGGGTPSLFSAKSYDQLFTALRARCRLLPNAEITLEANPGTFEQQRFKDYFELGINRLSIGIQSFNDKHLKILGRIHHGQEAMRAIDIAYNAGFTNVNLDLMHGLPQQTLSEGLEDLQKAIQHSPNHISWYQLTLEPNTFFYKHPPTLPCDHVIYKMQEQGESLLAQHGYQHYEVSAYAKPQQQSLHNRNYWQFGDYLGIGAGAHSKITNVADNTITRLVKKKQPKTYMDNQEPFIAEETIVDQDKVGFEFMLNALRLYEEIPITLFTARTGMPLDFFEKPLQESQHRGLLKVDAEMITVTDLGRRFLNDLMEVFLP